MSDTKDLAIAGDGAAPLPEAEVAEHVAKLRQAAEWVRSCTASEADDAYKQAKMVREWVRIHKASKKIAAEACRLQAIALRRLAQLSPDSMKGSEGKAGLWLARLSDSQFNAILSKSPSMTPLAIYNHETGVTQRQREEQWEKQRREADALARGRNEPVSFESVQETASELLHTGITNGAITVTEITEKLAEALEVDDHAYGAERFLIRSGLRDVVEEALRNEPSGDHPEFVTWKDSQLGWLRIPWSIASLKQLQWMAAYRQQQVRELQASADDLSRIAASLERAAASRPDLDRLPDLLQVAQEEVRAEAA